MKDCKPVDTLIVLDTKLMKKDSNPLLDATLYQSLIGSLMYLIATLLDIMYAFILMARFMHSPHESYWKVAKRILRYVSGTKSFGIWYKSYDASTLEAYIDVDWARWLDDRKSTSRYDFFFSGLLVSWSTKK